MSIREDARQEAERRWPSYPTVGFSGASDRQQAFIDGASWASERADRERARAALLDAQEVRRNGGQASRTPDRPRGDQRQERTMSAKAAAALAYVDKGIDNVADLDPDLAWTNAEVIELLEDVRSLLVTGRLTEGSFRGETNERDSDESA